MDADLKQRMRNPGNAVLAPRCPLPGGVGAALAPTAPSKAVLDDSLITVDTTSIDQHTLYYCTIVLSLCEISDDAMVFI